MKIINKGRGTGKTWDLIMEASKHCGSVIVAFNEGHKESLHSKIQKMHNRSLLLFPPKVVTTSEIRGMKSKGKRRWYVDELDSLLRNTIGFSPNTATMTGEVENYIYKEENGLTKALRYKVIDLIKSIDADTDLKVYDHIRALIAMIQENGG